MRIAATPRLSRAGRAERSVRASRPGYICLVIIATAVMSPRVEVCIHQHEISHEQPAKQRGDRPSPACVQINGSVKETITLLPSAAYLSGKWKAAVSPQERVTPRNAAALPPRGEFFPFLSKAVPQILSWNKIRSSEDLLWGLLKFPACLLNT